MNKKVIIIIACLIGISSIYTIFLITGSFLSHNTNINNIKEETSDKNKYDDLEQQQIEEDERREQEKLEEERRKEQERLEEEKKKETEEFDRIKQEIEERDKEKYAEAEANYYKRKEAEKDSYTDNERDIISDTNKNIVDKVVKLGFTKTDENCTKGFECYTDGTYILKYNPKGVYPEFMRITNDPNNKTYNSKADLEFLSEIYNLPNIKKTEGIINEVVNNFDNSGYNGFNVETSNIELYVSYSTYSNELSYRVSGGSTRNYKSNTISYLDTIIDKQEITRDNASRKFYYDQAINYNKNNYKYYDILDKYLESSAEICEMDFEGKNYYYFESSFCHSGTSNTYFRFKYNLIEPQVYDVVIVNLKGDYFKKNYLDVINSDLNYFASKGVSTSTLSAENIQNLNDFVQRETKQTIIVVSNNIYIELYYYPDSYYKDYKIKYYIG